MNVKRKNKIGRFCATGGNDNVTRLSTCTIYSWLLADYYRSRTLLVLLSVGSKREYQVYCQYQTSGRIIKQHGTNTLGGILAPPYLGENRLDHIVYQTDI